MVLLRIYGFVVKSIDPQPQSRGSLWATPMLALENPPMPACCLKWGI